MVPGSSTRRAVEPLVLVSLDARHEWHRYHHLFRDLLQRELEAIGLGARGATCIAGPRWTGSADNLDEAIGHATAAGRLR